MAEMPVTMAIRALRSHKVAFVPHRYTWEPGAGTAGSAAALGVDEHIVIKTLIFERDNAAPFCILMHGDREVSTKALARHLGEKAVRPCKPEVADRHSGYQVGGTSPFGLRKAMQVFMEASIADMPRMFINGGARGFLVEMAPADAIMVLQPSLVAVAVV